VTSSPTPSASEPEIEPAIVEGFAPVPQLPASEIPWGEVGPGWFVVDYSTSEEPIVDDIGEWYAYPQGEGGISLVSPDGQWYAAAEFSALGTGPVQGFDGSNLWMARALSVDGEATYYQSALFDLRTGEVVADEVLTAGALAPFELGRALDYAWVGDGLGTGVAGVDVDGMGNCSQAGAGFWGWEAQDMSFLYSPANDGQLVCFGPFSYGDTADVTLVDVANVSDSEKINTFSRGAEQYAFVGWIDEDNFFFARTGREAAPVMFRYDLRDDEIIEIDLPMYDDVEGGWGYDDGDQVHGLFDRVSQRHVIVREEILGEHEARATVSLFTADGSPAGNVALEYFPVQGTRAFSYRASGGRMLVTTVDPGLVAMYDLADGSLVGEWQVEGDFDGVGVFDAPEN
jgi:hypothetical protein